MAQIRNNEDLWLHAHIGPTYSVAYTGTAGRSPQLTSATLVDGFFRVVVSSDAYVRQGGGGVIATTSDMPLFIGQEAYVVVEAGTTLTTIDRPEVDTAQADFVSAIQQTAGGTLYVTDVSRTT